MPDRAAQFRELATWADGSDPLYAFLCRHVADDPDVLDLVETAPPTQQGPPLFLAAVHYLLAQDPAQPLAEYYGSLTDTPRPPDDCYPLFRAFCLDRPEAIESLLSTRRVQTNSVRRSAILYPALSHVAAHTDGPLALVELGPSAGLNLLFDRYRYDYDGTVVGDPDSPVTIESTVRDGSPPLPETPPDIHSRTGIDLNPLDVTDDADADWLRALIWPEHEPRRRVLEGALDVAREHPPQLVEGDLLDQLPAVLDEIPDDVPVCVFNTLVLYQVPDEVCDALRTHLTERMADRPLHWLSGERELSGGESVRLNWMRMEDGTVRTTRLVDYDPHGAWFDWQR